MHETLVCASPRRLYEANVLLSAHARRHRVDGYPGPLSIKHVVRGEARWQVGGLEFPLRSGEYLVTAHGERYSLEIDSPTPVETFIVFVSDALFAEVASTRFTPLARLLDDPNSRDPDRFAITRRRWSASSALAKPVALLRELAAAGAEQGHYDLALRSAIDAFADLELTSAAERERLGASRPATRRELHRRLLRGKAALEADLAATFDLQGIARVACLAPHHFHRSFRAAFGASPYAHLAALRLAEARRLLRESAQSVTGIALAVGYDSLPSFSSRFRRAFGMSPSACRRELRKRG